MTTAGKSRVQVIHFLSCGQCSGNANSIVTGTTKKVLLSEAVLQLVILLPEDIRLEILSTA